MQNRLLAEDIEDSGMRHKFIDPFSCADDEINAKKRTPDAYQANVDNVVSNMITLFSTTYSTNIDEWGWIFLPYNIA